MEGGALILKANGLTLPRPPPLDPFKKNWLILISMVHWQTYFDYSKSLISNHLRPKMRLHQTNLPPWEILMNVCSICCQLEKMHRSEDEEHMQDNLVFWLFDDFAKIKGKNIFAEHICIILARMRERSPRSERGRGTEDGLPDYSELCVVRGSSFSSSSSPS